MTCGVTSEGAGKDSAVWKIKAEYGMQRKRARESYESLKEWEGVADAYSRKLF